MATLINAPYSVKPICCTKPYYSPVPPKKDIRYSVRHSRRRKVNTEFHDALFSLGADDRTSHLSDAEFNRQVVSEVGYLFDTGISHLGNALRGVISLGRCLFSS